MASITGDVRMQHPISADNGGSNLLFIHCSTACCLHKSHALASDDVTALVLTPENLGGQVLAGWLTGN